MSFGRKTKTALAPFCLFFSLVISFQAQAANQCLDLFKVDLQKRYGSLVDHYRNTTEGLSKDEVFAQGLNLEMLYLLQIKMAETQTQYALVTNERDQLEAVQILPIADGSWQNQIALDVWIKHEAKVVVDLSGRNIEAGVFTGFDIQGFKYDRILILSLSEFLFDGLQNRSDVFRHELRHLGFSKKIRERALLQKIPLTTGMILAQKDSEGFRREILGIQENGYRDFMTFEELWTYTADAQFGVAQLLRRIKQQKNLNEIYKHTASIESAVRRLIVFFARTAQIGKQLSLQDFYSITTFIDPATKGASVSFMAEEKNANIDLLSEWTPLLYGHDIVHGIYRVKSTNPAEGSFWLSLPLAVREDPRSTDFVILQRRMNQRIVELVSASEKSRDELLKSYNRWRQATQNFLYSPHEQQNTKDLAIAYIQSLDALNEAIINTRMLLN